MTYVQCGRQHYSGKFNFKIFQLLFCSLKDDIIESTTQKVQAQERGPENINRSKERRDKKNQATTKFPGMALPTENQPVNGGLKNKAASKDTHSDSVWDRL